MLQKISNKTGSIFFKIFLTLLALVFVGWGVGDFLTGSTGGTALSVNGTDISVHEVARAYQQNVNKISEQYKQELNEQMRKSLKIGQRTLVTLVQKNLVQTEADDLDLRVSNTQLREEIQNNPAFRDENGFFSPEKYKLLMNNYGMSIEGFENLLRKELRQDHINNLFNPLIFSGHSSLDNFIKYNEENIDIKTISLDLEDIKLEEKPTEEELIAYYDKTKWRWKSPEYRRFEVLWLNMDALMEKIDVPEEDIQAEYEANKESYFVPETREVSQILVKEEAQAKELHAQLESGEDFIKLTKKHSQDKTSAENDGLLGVLHYEEMPEDMAEVAFELTENSLSQPVKSILGYHILKIGEISPEHDLPLEDVREEILMQIKAEEAESMYHDLAANLEERIAGGESLKDIAAALEIGHTEIPFVDTKGNVQDGSAYSFSFYQPEEGKDAMPGTVLREVFRYADIDAAKISDALELDENFIAYTSTKEKLQPTELPFEEVKEKVASDMNMSAQRRALVETANKIHKAVQKGTSLENAAREYGVEEKISDAKGITRQRRNAPGWLAENHIKAFFAGKPGMVSNQVIQQNQKYHIAVLEQKNAADLDEELRETAINQLAQEFRQDLRWQFMTHLHKNADISYKANRIKLAMPEENITPDTLLYK